MRSLKSFRQRWRSCVSLGRWLPGILLLVLAAGCGEPAQIEEYTIPKPQPKPDHPPMMGRMQPMPRPPQAGPAQTGGPSYDAPEEWIQVPNKPLTVGTFQVASEDKDTLVTIIPLGPFTEGSLLPNLNRWRGQVGLSPLGENDPLDLIEEVQLADSSTGRYLKLENDGKAMLMMFVENAGRTWYFKLMGDAELVQKEEPRFKSFVQSVRFSPKEEAGDE